MNEEAFLAAITEDPAEPTTWLALADWLEEHGDPRGEVLRRTRGLLEPGGEQRAEREERLRRLLAEGVRPCWPTLTNSIGVKLALIPSGTFLMGSPESEADRQADEGPRHQVAISRPFYLGVFPVTQEQYERVTGVNPSWFSSQGGGSAEVHNQETRIFPVEQVSWEDAVAFCGQMSKMADEKRLGRVYRLPTEAEWEYSCRGGTCSSTPFFFGPSLSSTQANFNGRFPYGQAAKGPFLRHTTAVGSYPANAFGLFDMHGNIWEWCQDWYDPEYYANSPSVDPRGPPPGHARVRRGGSWNYNGRNCRCAFRHASYDHSSNFIGFRVALTIAARMP